MLYTSISVPVPEHQVLKQKRAGGKAGSTKDGPEDIYVLALLDDWKDEQGERRTSRKRRIIGKIIPGTDGKQMHPNTFYYEHFSLPLPEVDPADTALPGRRPQSPGSKTAAGTKAARKSVKTLRTWRPGLAPQLPCWPVVCDRILQELGLYTLLQLHFGPDNADKLCLLASICAQDGSPDRGNLELAARKESVWPLALDIDDDYCRKLHSVINEKTLAPFFQDWNQRCKSSQAVCFQISDNLPEDDPYEPCPVGPSEYFSCYLICDCRSGMPLCFTFYFEAKDPEYALKSTLQNARLHCAAPQKLLLIPFRDLFTPAYLKALTSLKVDFIGAQPSTEVTAVYDDVLEQQRLAFSKNQEHLKTALPADPELEEQEELFGTSRSLTWDQVRLKAWFYYSPDLAQKELTDLNSVAYTQNPAYLKEQKKAAGTFMLLTSPELKLSQRRILKLMQERERDCKFFDELLSRRFLPTKVKYPDNIAGRLFVFFLALIIKKELCRRMGAVLKSAGRSFSFIPAVLSLYGCSEDEDGTLQLIDWDNIKRPKLYDLAAKLLDCLN